MSWIIKNLVQDITHWAMLTTLDIYGNPTWAAPSVVKGRWEEQNQLIIDSDGNEVVSRAMVFLVSNVAEGDYLMLREFTSGETDPTQIEEADRVLAFKKTPDLRGTLFERVAML